MKSPLRQVPQPSTAFTLEDQRQMTRARNYFAWQSRLVLREVGQRVVEVGCGIGNLTGLLLDRELVVALDPEAACVERLRQRYGPRENLQTLVCDTARPEFRELARRRPDSCVCVNVLEHIEDDSGAVDAMASILMPGGVIVLLVPAFEALYGPIDRNLGTYNEWNPTPLHLAATLGVSSIVKVLLAKGAAVNARDKNGQTPLHLLSLSGGISEDDGDEARHVAEVLLATGLIWRPKTTAAVHRSTKRSRNNRCARS